MGWNNIWRGSKPLDILATGVIGNLIDVVVPRSPWFMIVQCLLLPLVIIY